MQRSRIRLDGDDVVDDRVDLAGCALVSVSLPRDDSQRFPGLRPTDGRLDVQDSEFVWLLVTTAAVNPVPLDGCGGSLSFAHCARACFDSPQCRSRVHRSEGRAAASAGRGSDARSRIVIAALRATASGGRRRALVALAKNLESRVCVTEAIHRVIVHEPRGLQVRVDDRRADEAKAALLEIPPLFQASHRHRSPAHQG